MTASLIDYFRKHAVTPEMVEKYRLGAVINPVPGDEDFTGALSIPYLTRTGVVRIKFRLLNGGPKFLYHTGDKQTLYNVRACREADDAIGITEGEVDAIVATEVLKLPCVAVPGVETWSPNKAVWRYALNDFESVIVLADGDPPQCGHKPKHDKGECPDPTWRPGRELGKAIKESLGWRCRVIEMPEGEDVSSMVAAGRQQEILGRIGG